MSEFQRLIFQDILPPEVIDKLCNISDLGKSTNAYAQFNVLLKMLVHLLNERGKLFLKRHA